MIATRIPRAACLALAALLVACSEPEPADEPTRQGEPGGAEPTVAEPGGDEPEAPEPGAASCEDLLSEARAPAEAVIDEHGACEFAVDCVEAAVETSCFSDCGRAVHPRGRAALRDALAASDEDVCPAVLEAQCETPRAECARASPSCRGGRCVMDEGDPVLAEVPVPPGNARARADDPPPRPPGGEVEQERARRLLAAIAADEPSLAQDFFFPKEAFRHVKGIADPDAYWDRLFARYEQDIHALHESLPGLEDAELVGLEIVRRGGWVAPGEEANALPYWVARHNRLRYRVGGEERTLEVRVLITWGDRWYITHLSEFH